MTKTKFQVRATVEQVTAWREAARKRQIPLSQWVRKVLDAYASKEKGES